MPCAFGKFNQGQASLTCKGGAWIFNHELCHSSGVAIGDKSIQAYNAGTNSCTRMKFTYRLNDLPHVYTLESAEVGAQKNEPCSHGKFTQGEVFFECKDTIRGPKWSFVKKTCRVPPGSGCAAIMNAPLKMTINGKKLEWLFNLEETQAPGVHEFPCPDGYSGNARFECTFENLWIYHKGSAKCLKDH